MNISTEMTVWMGRTEDGHLKGFKSVETFPNENKNIVEYNFVLKRRRNWKNAKSVLKSMQNLKINDCRVNQMIERIEYLKRLIEWKDEQVIKVVTGIRRCGKSTLLKQYQEWLKQKDISENQIISINFEELEFEELQD